MDPRSAQTFRFLDCRYQPSSGTAELAYRFDDGPELIERIRFPESPWPADPGQQAAFECALQILHLVAGVSYYKAGLGCAIALEQPAAGLEDFLNGLYRRGLAEMAWVNGLDGLERIRFPAAGALEIDPGVDALELPERALVAMGGGKDSLVGLEMLRSAGLEVTPVCVGESPLIRDTVQAAGLPLVQIRRELAPGLRAMNEAGAWNGHVPVTAINSAILLCAAILYGYDQVVFSNERSADEATLRDELGREVNHQYSKSSEFERDFQRVIRARLGPGIRYYSILRPFSELAVLQRFSALTQYHDVFSSCNRNFHLDGPRLEGRWCGNCPKCRFAALGLALFMPPTAVRAILGADLLDDPAQEEGFRSLCRLGREKPFECVGEAGESRAAVLALSEMPAWAGHEVIRRLRPELEAVAVPSLDSLLRPSARHGIPRRLAARLGLPGAGDER